MKSSVSQSNVPFAVALFGSYRVFPNCVSLFRGRVTGTHPDVGYKCLCVPLVHLHRVSSVQPNLRVIDPGMAANQFDVNQRVKLSEVMGTEGIEPPR